MKDGEAAFPEHKMIHDKKTGEFLALSCNGGMTLRDYFAGQALAGVIIDPSEGQTYGQIAEVCYNLADAMLAEREKHDGKK